MGTGARTPPPLKNHKNIGFLSNTGPDPLKNHKATTPTFKLRFAGGPMMTRFQWYLDPLIKKSWTPSKKISGSAHAIRHMTLWDILFEEFQDGCHVGHLGSE